jgi:hypothetical protein
MGGFMRFRVVLLCVCLVMLGLYPSFAQTSPDLQLQTEVGFGGYFRADEWLPLRVTATNTGQAVSGKLIVRPETNGRVLSNAYSTALDLPAGANKTTFLFVQARDFARELTLEFVTDDGVRLAQETLTLTSLAPRDKLYVVVTDSTRNAITLGDVNPPEQNAYAIRWQTQNLPENAFALEPIDALFISNIDEGSLTSAQQEALQTWVAQGGHLVVMGGVNWQGINDTLGTWLPLQATGSTTRSDVSALAQYSLQSDEQANQLSARTLVTIGTPHADARILAQQDNTPLLLRRSVGDGVVDFLALDPTTEPLRTWANLPQFWLYLLSTPISTPWGRGILDKASVANALAILPNEQLLPPVEALIGFIVAYIVMIGPVNYWVLTRLKRQEWAWVTIPVFIVLFTLLATIVGFNLRGNEVILSRLRVVQVWDTADNAVEQTVLGLLSPRRGVYSLLPADNRLMYALPSIAQNPSLLQSSVEMVQTNTFNAESFGAEGGIFSNFASQRTLPKPPIGGQFSLITNADNSQTLQGSIRNDSDLTLTQAMIITRDMAYFLPTDIAPNDLITIDAGQIVLANTFGMPIPSRLENSTTLPEATFRLGRSSGFTDDQITANRLLSAPVTLDASPQTRTYLRRQAFLKSFVRDQYNSTTLGDGAYLLAWTNDIPRDWMVPDATWRSVDDTLYIVQLAITPEPLAPNQIVTLTPDRFVWTMTERILNPDELVGAGTLPNNNTQGGIDDILLNPDEGFAVRFTPLENAKLNNVSQIEIRFARASGFANQIEMSLWNWQAQAWEVQPLKIQEYTLEQPQAYIASDGSVLLKFVSTYPSGTSRIRDLKLTMTGTQ